MSTNIVKHPTCGDRTKTTQQKVTSGLTQRYTVIKSFQPNDAISRNLHLPEFLTTLSSPLIATRHPPYPISASFQLEVPHSYQMKVFFRMPATLLQNVGDGFLHAIGSPALHHPAARLHIHCIYMCIIYIYIYIYIYTTSPVCPNGTLSLHVEDPERVVLLDGALVNLNGLSHIRITYPHRLQSGRMSRMAASVGTYTAFLVSSDQPASPVSRQALSSRALPPASPPSVSFLIPRH